MKITKSKLKQIIKEELESVLKEKEELEAAMSGILPGDQKLPELDPYEAVKMVCAAKPIIITALDNPKFGRPILEGIFKAKGGEFAKFAIQLVNQFEDMTGHKVEDILKQPGVKDAVVTALNLGCMFVK
jgi:hypothetical protein